METSISSPDPIAEAASWQNKVFYASIVAAILFAAVAGLISLLLYRAGNTYQDSVKRDSDAKVAIARAEAEKANAGVADATLQIASAQKETALARAEAAKANEETARLNKEAENARKDIAIAQQQAAEANEKTKELEQTNLTLRGSVATLEKDAAEAKRAYIEISERIRPRQLSHDQITAMVTELQKYPEGKVRIITLGDQEAEAYANQFINAIAAAGWKFEIHTIGIITPPRYGVTIATSNRSRPEVLALTTALLKSNIKFDVIENQPTEPTTLGIWLRPGSN